MNDTSANAYQVPPMANAYQVPPMAKPQQQIFSKESISFAVSTMIPKIEDVQATFKKEAELKRQEMVAEFESYLKDCFSKIVTASESNRKCAELNPIINRPWCLDTILAFEEAGYEITRNDGVMFVVKFIKDEDL